MPSDSTQLPCKLLPFNSESADCAGQEEHNHEEGDESDASGDFLAFKKARFEQEGGRSCEEESRCKEGRSSDDNMFEGAFRAERQELNSVAMQTDAKPPRPIIHKVQHTPKHPSKRVTIPMKGNWIVRFLIALFTLLSVDTQSAFCMFSKLYSMSTASVCSGTGCELCVTGAYSQMLEDAGAFQPHLWACDNDLLCRQFLREIWNIEHIFTDFTHFGKQPLTLHRAEDEASDDELEIRDWGGIHGDDERLPKRPSVLYAGIPCQDATSLSTKTKSDEARECVRTGTLRTGSLAQTLVAYLKSAEVGLCYVENVLGLLLKSRATGMSNGEVLANELRSAGYLCIILVVNSWFFGTPQNRPRVFFVALRYTILNGLCKNNNLNLSKTAKVFTHMVVQRVTHFANSFNLAHMDDVLEPEASPKVQRYLASLPKTYQPAPQPRTESWLNKLSSGFFPTDAQVASMPGLAAVGCREWDALLHQQQPDDQKPDDQKQEADDQQQQQGQQQQQQQQQHNGLPPSNLSQDKNRCCPGSNRPEGLGPCQTTKSKTWVPWRNRFSLPREGLRMNVPLNEYQEKKLDLLQLDEQHLAGNAFESRTVAAINVAVTTSLACVRFPSKAILESCR